MSNNTAEKKKMEEVCALWKQKSNDGKKTYFSGITADEAKARLTGFYNTDKKNMKEADLRIYLRDDEGNLSKDPFLSLWCNASAAGKKYLSGKIDGRRVVGFINEKATEKQPYISIYWSDDQSEEAPKAEEKPKAAKGSKKGKAPKKEPEYEEIPSDEKLPF